MPEAEDSADLEFSEFQLQHVLAGRQYKYSWEQLSVGLHLTEHMYICEFKWRKCTPNRDFLCATSYYFEEMTLTYLVESVDIFPIGCEIHETCCQVNQATNHQILLAELLLGAAAKLSAPHHIAVTPLHTDRKRILHLN